MDEIVKELLPFFAGVGLTGVLAAYLIATALTHPETVQIWWAWILGAISKVFKGTQKHYYKHNIEGRVNDFARSLEKEIPSIKGTRIKVELMDGDITRASFFEKDQVIVRLKKSDSAEKNFVHAAYLAVTEALLTVTKRYISPSQRLALDLFVTGQLLSREQKSALAFFLDEYLHPKTETRDSKIGVYIDKFTIMHRAGLFFPVFVQELSFLGGKVFGHRKDDKIIIEVNSFVKFLEGVSTRRIGTEETDLTFNQQYCRFALVIVGKQRNLTHAGEKFTRFILLHLVPERFETIYLLGRAENKEILDNIAANFSNTYEVNHTRTNKAGLFYDDELKHIDQYLVVLRLRDISVFQTSDQTTITRAKR